MSWCKYTIQLIPLSVSCLLIPFMYFLYIFKLNTNLQMFPEICCFKWRVVSIFPNRISILVKLISTESILLLCGIDHFCVGIMLVFVRNRIRVSAWARLLACTSFYYHLLICIINTVAMFVSSQDEIKCTLLYFCIHYDTSYFSSSAGGKGGDITNWVTVGLGKILHPLSHICHLLLDARVHISQLISFL